MKVFIFVGMIVIGTSTAFAGGDLKHTIESQASTVFATADSAIASDQAVCFEFGKLLGLGQAYKVTQEGTSLENYINETVALYGEQCKSSKLSKLGRNEISQLSKSIFNEINN